MEFFIDMQHIPVNKLTGKTEFLGVYAQFIQFTERFPVMENKDGVQFKLDFKAPGYEVWNTVYLSGAADRVREAYYDNVTSLTYVARHENPNITFLGFNPVYYYHEDKIPELLTFINEIFEEEPGFICKSEIVPIEVTYEHDKITIHSDRDGVSTGIANLDCFMAAENEEKISRNNLVVVDSLPFKEIKTKKHLQNKLAHRWAIYHCGASPLRRS